MEALSGRILFVTGEYPPMVGGVGAYTEQIARALQAQGCATAVYTSQQARCTHTPSEDSAIGVPVLATVTRWDWRIWQDVIRTARSMQAQWVHVQYQTVAFGMNPAINVAPLWWRRAGLRVAWTYHDLAVPYLFPKAGPLRPWITYLPARTCDLTVVTNEGDRLQLGHRARQVAKIPIGSNIHARPVDAAEKAARRQAHGFGSSDLVLGYFGFLNRGKGAATLIRTLHRLCQTHPAVWLLMVGDPLGASDPYNVAYLQEVEALAKQLGVAERIVRTGFLPDSEISGELAICDVLVMPYEAGASLRHGTLMAALAHGCAIVTTTPSTPLPELVHERDLLYVPPGDDVAAANAVQRLMAEPQLAQSLRTHAQQRSLLFSWEAIAEEHVRAYQLRMF